VSILESTAVTRPIHNTDHARFRHARERKEGFHVGRYLQTPPFFFTADCHQVNLVDHFKGASLFLVCGGPSLKEMNLDFLNHRGFISMGVNNDSAVHRTSMWVSVDDPSHFCDAIWRDPGVMKFCPLCHANKNIFKRSRGGRLVKDDSAKVSDMPNLLFYRRNETFRAEQFLYEDSLNWGNEKHLKDAYGHKGSRSVMYIAIRLAFLLGFRTVYLVGCDFRMEEGKENYAFPQDRTGDSVRGNNSTYRIFNDRMQRVLPYLEQEGMEVFNCTPQSGLTVWPFLPLGEAIRKVRKTIPEKIDTYGMYDKKARNGVKTK
jgi:hypothetical protein